MRKRMMMMMGLSSDARSKGIRFRKSENARNWKGLDL